MGTKNYVHIKSYGPFRGLNKGVSEINLQDGFFSKAVNATILPGSTALAVRPGWQPSATALVNPNKKIFVGLYIDVDAETGVQTEKELLLNLTAGSAEVIEPFTITITNATAFDFEVDAVMGIDPNTGRHRFQLINNGNNTVIFSQFLSSAGVPNVTVDALVSAIDALSEFSAVKSSGSNGAIQAVTALPISRTTIPADSSRTIKGYTTRNLPIASGLPAAINYDTLKAIAYTNMQNALYFAIPGVGLCKFDGQSVGRAGVPRFKSIDFVSFGAPNTNGVYTGYYVYAAAYELRDAKGGVLEGLGECTRFLPSGGNTGSVGNGPGFVALTAPFAGVTGTTVTMGFDNLLPTDYKHDVRGAILNGAQYISASSLTLTVDSGHTIQPNDRICFKGILGAGGGVVAGSALYSALVTAVTATTITLSPSKWEVTNLSNNSRYNVKNETYLLEPFAEETDLTIAELDAYITTPNTNTIADNAVISNNARINIYRNKGEGLAPSAFDSVYPLLYLLDIIPNNPFSATTAYGDVYRDSRLSILWEQKIEIGAVPFEADAGLSKHVTICHAHQGRMYLAGDPENINVLYRSDLLFGPEWYNPFGAADLNLETKVASKITAIGSTSDNLVVGKSRGIKLISGDLGSDTNIRVDDISFELGLVNQASTVSAIDKCIGITQLGPIEIATSGQFQFIGSQDLGTKSRLEGVFKQGDLDLNYAAATVNMEKGYFVFYVPNKQNVGLTTDLANSYNQFSQQASLITNQPDNWGSCYVYITTQDAWFEWNRLEATGGAYIKDGRLHTAAQGSVGLLLCGESDSKTLSDYADYNEGIEMDIATNWIHLNEPYLFKQFISASVQNTERDELSQESYQAVLSAEKDWVEDVSQTSQAILDLDSVSYRKVKIKGNKSRSMRIRAVSSEICTRPCITGITVEISAPFRPKINKE